MTPDEAIRLDEQRDHARAGDRGERLADLTDVIMDTLVAHGLGGAHVRLARVAVFHVLADDIYGNRCVDMPLRWSER